MPLTIAPINKELTVRKMFMETKLRKHLCSLGITVNSKLTILSQSKGNIVVFIKGSRIALDYGVAKNIFIG